MNDLLIKWFTQLNSFLIRRTGGTIGSQLGTQGILILHTVGRKTGQPRATPIAYFDSQGKYLRVASNLGRDKHADRLLNLRRIPIVVPEPAR
jgi:F420H(2)-dependent quinone reductase